MPKINKLNQKTYRATYDSEDWLGGLHPYPTQDLSLLQQGGNLFSYQQSINPFRFLGHLTCGRNGTAVTNAEAVMTSYILNGYNSGDNAWLIEATKVHKLNHISHTMINDTAGTGYPHTISHGAHTSIVSSDCVLYNHKVGGTSALRFLYSFSDATDWDIGTCDMATVGTFDDDFMSTAPATPLGASYITEGKGYPHPMIVGHDDICYIADRNYIHAYDGQDASDNDGKFFPAVLTLPKEYTIRGFAKFPPRSLAAFASSGIIDNSSAAQSAVFFWDYLSLDPYEIKTIDENILTAPFEYMNTTGCIGYGRDGRKKLYIYNGNIFKDVAWFSGNPPINGGIDILGEEIRFLSGGKLYSYGNQYGLEKKLNCIDRFDYTSNGSGFYRVFSTSNGDYYSTDTKNFKYLNNGGYDGSNGIFYTTYQPLGKIRVKEIKVFFSKVTNGIGFKLSLGSFNGTEYLLLNGLSNISIDDLKTVIKPYTYTGAIIPELNGLYLHGEFTGGTGTSAAPIINKIEIDYEPTEFV